MEEFRGIGNFQVSFEMPLKGSHVYLVQFDVFSVDDNNIIMNIRVLVLITEEQNSPTTLLSPLLCS